MTKYWIVVDNAHEGPFTAEELVQKNVSPETFAWHPGLPKWTQVKDIAELAALLAEMETVDEITGEHREEPEAIETVSVSAEAETTAAPAPEPAPASRPTPPPAPPLAPAQPVYTAPQPAPACNQPAFVPRPEVPKCPPSYLAWSIVCTILFFLPLGIVAIIYSAKVKSLWSLGDYNGAHRASETTAWLSNISFVVGLIWMPFSMVVAMMF